MLIAEGPTPFQKNRLFELENTPHHIVEKHLPLVNKYSRIDPRLLS